jgi:signal transduction histidine kinase
MSITLVFFIYGLAFFSMGLAMFFESARSPILAERRVLIPLAIFGFVHGGHEWLEMFLDKSEWLVVQNPIFWGWLRIGILIVSFTSLVVFGLELLYPQQAFVGPGKFRWILALVLYILVVLVVGIIAWKSHDDFLSHMDAAARYFIAVPGAALAGIALYREADRAYHQGPPGLGIALRLAAWGFIIYALTQAVVPPLDIFPANVLNTSSFRAWTGMPIQGIRATVAVLITVGLLRATKVVEEERQRQFLAVQQSRIDALERLEQELKARETMRQEHLRHIVEAQEEERARIARELHDDASQTLTAFTFHLGALRNILAKDKEATLQLDQLQSLSRRMAVGIYRLVHDLRPTQLDELGLVAALHYLTDQVGNQMDLKVKLEILGERRRLDPLVETAFYRIAHEALTNTARHSGVKTANLRLSFQSNQTSLLIADGGTGFLLDNIMGSGWGLAGMRERAESIGGKMEIRTSPGKGTEIEILLPNENALQSSLSDSKESNNYAENQINVGG